MGDDTSGGRALAAPDQLKWTGKGGREAGGGAGGGELRGEGDLPASPSLSVESREGEEEGRDTEAGAGTVYGENRGDLAAPGSGDLGESADSAGRKGEAAAPVRGGAAAEVLTMAASSAGL